MRSIIMILSLICTGLINAQSGESGQSKKALTSIFSTATLSAWQENSQNEVDDFYQYLSLLTDSKLDPALKAQLYDNIFSLFEQPAVLVEDFVAGKGQIPLDKLLDKLSEKAFGNFKIVDQTTFEMAFDHWTINYTLSIDDGSKSLRKISQKVYLKQTSKTFGTTTKQTWKLMLGGME
jgi:hypothetical protein